MINLKSQNIKKKYKKNIFASTVLQVSSNLNNLALHTATFTYSALTE